MIAFGRFKFTSSMLKSIGNICFDSSREVGLFSEGLLREVLLYSPQHQYVIISHE